jgi:starvation-inducible outer membrane lipoprotein
MINESKNIRGYMKNTIWVLILTMLSSCSALPQLYQAAEDIADDDAVKVVVSREAIQKQTDVTVSVDIKNTKTTK